MAIAEENLARLNTEVIDPRFSNIDDLPIIDLLEVFNESDKGVAVAVSKIIPSIARAISEITKRMGEGGRLFYVGAGTSGRLGVLDASECVPTFSIDQGIVVALMAGGDAALRTGFEGEEDIREGSHAELKAHNLSSKDIVLGIAASGRTPYVIGALELASTTGALSVSLSCNTNAEISKYADFPIEVDSGPEVLAGSTRLKAGTAQKLILNMISTITMIGLGKTYGNLMVDLQVSNEKLRDRALRIIQAATKCDNLSASKALDESGDQVKVAIVMLLLGVTRAEAEKQLVAADSRIRKVISNSQNI